MKKKHTLHHHHWFLGFTVSFSISMQILSFNKQAQILMVRLSKTLYVNPLLCWPFNLELFFFCLLWISRFLKGLRHLSWIIYYFARLCEEGGIIHSSRPYSAPDKNCWRRQCCCRIFVVTSYFESVSFQRISIRYLWYSFEGVANLTKVQ